MMRKNFWITALLLLSASVLSAQGLVIGARVADLKTTEYLTSRQSGGDLPLLIEFFYSASEPCRQHLPVLDDLARAYGGKLDVVVLVREDREKIEPLLEGNNYAFAVALDDNGKTFNAYGVKFVPFSVLLDAKGRVLWFGNSSRLDNATIDGALK